MSTEYFIFINSNDIGTSLTSISNVGGVKLFDGGCRIEGLMYTECKELDQATRLIMKNDYADSGLDVNWRIGGTYDESYGTDELILRLFKCFVAIVEGWPEKDASLMRNAENFYAINKKDEVLIASTYMKSIPGLMSLFDRLQLTKRVTVCLFQ